MSKSKKDLQTIYDWASQIATVNKEDNWYSKVAVSPTDKEDIGIADDVSTTRNRISDLEAQLKELKIKKKRRKLKIKVKM